jgi:uncharacterized membrane protein YphA (DoxX/SURF4 family)
MVDTIGGKCKDYAPFVLRLGLGMVFIMWGVQDLSQLSASPPLWTAAAAGLKVLCGLLALIGWLTRWAAAGLATLMIIYIVQVPQLHAFIHREDQWAFAYLVMSVAVFFTGGGKCSVDLRNKHKEGT